MALLHRAELSPSKLELIAGWLPGRPWYHEPDADGLARVAAYRFDDPAGEVGVETMLVRSGDGPLYQVALTYRGAPLAGADDHLIGTTDHSVLGRRWVYDACGDPVYAAALAAAIAGAPQAEEFFEVDGELQGLAATMTISSTGSGLAVPPADATVIGDDLVVVRRLDTTATAGEGRATAEAGSALRGSWAGQAPVLLAYAAV